MKPAEYRTIPAVERAIDRTLAAIRVPRLGRRVRAALEAHVAALRRRKVELEGGR
jgi:hypothetical protein